MPNLALKLPLYFYLLMEKQASWSLLPSLVSILSDITVEPESTYSGILKVSISINTNIKRISINTDYSYHQHSSP